MVEQMAAYYPHRELAAIAALRSAESSGANKLFVKRLSKALQLQVGTMLDQMSAVRPAQEQHPDTAAMYQPWRKFFPHTIEASA